MEQSTQWGLGQLKGMTALLSLRAQIKMQVLILVQRH